MVLVHFQLTACPCIASFDFLFRTSHRQLKWIIKGAERLETLVSISTDGRVLEWNLKKGLVVSSLMQLKKSGTVSCFAVAILRQLTDLRQYFSMI